MKAPLLVLFSLISLAYAEPVTQEGVKAAVAQLETLTSEQIKSTGVPGIAIAVVYKGEIVFAKGFGVRVAGKNEAVDADTVFQLASLSKPVGSTVLATLVGEDSVSWDTRISDLDPSFQMSDPWVTREVTIRDLYAHRSGLPDHAGDLLEDLGYDREEILRRLRYQRPSSSFRSAYAYTNFGMTEGALAAAKASGKEWEQLSDEKLYRPLGMTSTSSRFADFAERQNRALGHVQADGKWVQKFQREPDAQTPAGGVSSSVNDMAKWMILQMADGNFEGRQIVPKGALTETHLPQIRRGISQLDGLPTFYGLGWNVNYDMQGRLRLSHSGAFAMGAATSVFLVPAEQLGVIVLTNAAPIGLAEALGATFLDLVLYGAPQRNWVTLYKEIFARMEQEEKGVADYSKPPTKPRAAADLSAYVGTYKNDYYGDAVVVQKDGALALVMGPKHATFPMTHWDRDIFTYETAGENAVGKAGLFFTLGPDGKAAAVVVENLNTNGEGTFLRVADGAKP